ncbi:MAG: RimK family alpha-L-glutamate ligase [Planctomycetota bacterium]
MTIKKTVGLLVGDELDWPDTIEALWGRLGPRIEWRGETYEIEIRRLRIDPFSLRHPSKYDLVIDRLAYWHYQPREWLKKAALLDKTYLLNNPFTFQSMEKHSAYCAAIRLGLNVPETWLIPPKQGPQSYAEKYRRTAARYHDFFDLARIAEHIGYPLFMKPFDGGGWRDVTRIEDRDKLFRAYDASGQSVMHLQQGINDYDVFTRSLAIGPQVMSLKFNPEKPHHARYSIDHDFLPPEEGRQVRIITKLINAFFRWDFNSCETIHKDGVVYPIDFANACPDVAVHSLHYYYPWAMKALLAWSLFCVITGRKFHLALTPEDYFAVGDSEMSYEEKLGAYEALADRHFQRAEFEAFRAEQLAGLDGAMWELVQAPDFDRILTQTLDDTFPAHERQAFFRHYKGLLMHWVQSTAKHWGPKSAEGESAEGAAAEAEAAPAGAAEAKPVESAVSEDAAQE